MTKSFEEMQAARELKHAEAIEHASDIETYRAYLCSKNPHFAAAKCDELVKTLYDRLLWAENQKKQVDDSDPAAAGEQQAERVFALKCDYLTFADRAVEKNEVARLEAARESNQEKQRLAIALATENK